MSGLRCVGRLARAAVVAAMVAVAAGCAQDTVGAIDLVHVHDLIVDDGQPTYVAAHTGLHEIHPDGTVRVDDSLDDLMAATRSDAGELMASGHPQLDDDRLQVPGAPPLLGLVVRQDGVWQPRSLLGEADFHALATRGDLVVGADGTSGSVLVSTDAGRTWEPRGRVELVALAMAPDEDDLFVGVTYDGTVVTSDDGGRTWHETGDVEAAIDVAWPRTGPVVLTESGSVERVGGGGTELVSTLQGAVAITTDGDALVALIPPAGLRTSVDGGRTWEGGR